MPDDDNLVDPLDADDVEDEDDVIVPIDKVLKEEADLEDDEDEVTDLDDDEEEEELFTDDE